MVKNVKKAPAKKPGSLPGAATVATQDKGVEPDSQPVAAGRAESKRGKLWSRVGISGRSFNLKSTDAVQAELRLRARRSENYSLVFLSIIVAVIAVSGYITWGLLENVQNIESRVKSEYLTEERGLLQKEIDELGSKKATLVGELKDYMTGFGVKWEDATPKGTTGLQGRDIVVFDEKLLALERKSNNNFDVLRSSDLGEHWFKAGKLEGNGFAQFVPFGNHLAAKFYGQLGVAWYLAEADLTAWPKIFSTTSASVSECNDSYDSFDFSDQFDAKEGSRVFSAVYCPKTKQLFGYLIDFSTKGIIKVPPLALSDTLSDTPGYVNLSKSNRITVFTGTSEATIQAQDGKFVSPWTTKTAATQSDFFAVADDIQFLFKLDRAKSRIVLHLRDLNGQGNMPDIEIGVGDWDDRFFGDSARGTEKQIWASIVPELQVADFKTYGVWLRSGLEQKRVGYLLVKRSNEKLERAELLVDVETELPPNFLLVTTPQGVYVKSIRPDGLLSDELLLPKELENDQILHVSQREDRWTIISATQFKDSRSLSVVEFDEKLPLVNRRYLAQDINIGEVQHWKILTPDDRSFVAVGSSGFSNVTLLRSKWYQPPPDVFEEELGLRNYLKTDAPKSILNWEKYDEIDRTLEWMIERKTRIQNLGKKLAELPKDAAYVLTADKNTMLGLDKSFVQTTLARFLILGLLFFVVKVLINLYRYFLRLAAYYRGRADGLALVTAVDGNVGTKLPDKLPELFTALSPDSLDLGPNPKTPIGEATDAAIKLIEAARKMSGSTG